MLAARSDLDARHREGSHVLTLARD
jgi:hypothetical protein